MKRKWIDPPDWDEHLEAAVEEVNSLYPETVEISLSRTDPQTIARELEDLKLKRIHHIECFFIGVLLGMAYLLCK